MTKKKKNPFTYICGDLLPGTDYSFHHLIELGVLYGYTYDEVMKALFTEIQKKNPRIVLGFNKNAFLNPKNRSNKKVIEPIKTETEIIAEAVIKKNKEFIQKWIETEFDKKLESLVQKYVVSEFKEEVLPVLIDRIDGKFKNIQESHTKSIKVEVIQILSDMIIKAAQEEIPSNED